MMRRSGLELNESNFGTALVTVGEAMSQLADAKNQLDDSVKAEFLGKSHNHLAPLQVCEFKSKVASNYLLSHVLELTLNIYA